jgi:outer membrane protein assembly factor BamA
MVAPSGTSIRPSAQVVEVSTPELVSGLRLLGFADAGYLRNNKPNALNRPSSDRLASLGVGLRFARGPWALSADYGRLVQGSRVPLTVNSWSPRKGDDRFYISVSARF